MSKGFTLVLTLILCVGAAIVRAEPLDIFINEILYDPDSSAGSRRLDGCFYD